MESYKAVKVEEREEEEEVKSSQVSLLAFMFIVLPVTSDKGLSVG